MGFHICEYCTGPRPATGSGDVILQFAPNTWIMPDMIIHYIEAQEYLPEADFFNDIQHGVYLVGGRLQTKSPTRKVGYLHGPYQRGKMADSVLAQLKLYIQDTTHNGMRWQTRGI